MTTALVLVLCVAPAELSAPDAGAPAPEPAAARSEAGPGTAPPAASAPVSLASPGLSYVDFSEQKGAMFTDHLARQLELLGLRVTGKSEMQALLGFERQRQLLGCTDEAAGSCLAELAGALGADGVITGTLGRIGQGYVVNLKVVTATGAPLAVASGRVGGDEALLDWLAVTAYELSAQVHRALGRAVPAAPEVKPKVAAPVAEVSAAAPAGPRWWLAPVVVGAVALLGGVAGLIGAHVIAGDLRSGEPFFVDTADLDARVGLGRTLEQAGWALVVTGVALVAGGVAVSLLTGAPSPKVALVVTRESAVVAFSGALP